MYWRILKMDWMKHAFKILNTIAIPILVIDRNYHIVVANNAACRSFCLPTEDIVGNKCFKIAHKLDSPCWHKGIGCPTKIAFEFKEQTTVIHEHIYRGKTVFEEITASPIFDDCGAVEFIVEELNDITELIQSKEITDHLKKDIKTLQGLIPICAKCKSIRDDKGYWSKIESYISNHLDVQFTHGLCEECTEELYGKTEWYIKNEKRMKNKDKNA
jgi:PAS domain S-box-containing protein